MLEDYADNPWIVLTAYIAVFFPWTAVTASDFLSANWKSVADARRDGQLQLLFVLIPTAYIAFYIYVQLVAQDFKEAFAAVVGLIFSVLHLLRTIWGLAQLRQFHRWAARAISALRFAGIEYKLDLEDRLHHGDRVLSPDEVADRILINDSVVDNQLLHGEVRCYLRYGTCNLRVAPSSAAERFPTSMFSRIALSLIAILLPVHWLISRITVAVAAALFNVQLRPPRRLHQIPLEPIELWLNWAAAFVSQGLGEWLLEMEHVAEHPDSFMSHHEDDIMKLYKSRRAYFAGEILASSVLQLGRDATGKGFMSNPMLWNQWGNTSDMCDGRVTKQQLLREAVKAGDGLPFEYPHDEILANIKGWSLDTCGVGEDAVGYGSYTSKLWRVVESMPAGFGDEIGRFNVAKLEWFTILLFVGIVGLRNQEKLGTAKQPDSSEWGSVFPCKGSHEESIEFMGDEDIAIDNLGVQLGFERSALGSVLSINDAELRVFPFDTKPISLLSATNRLVHRVAEFIDVWLALLSGEQISFLLSIDENWKDLCLGKEQELTSELRSPSDGALFENSTPSSQTGANESNPTLRESQTAVVRAALEHRFANNQQRYSHMEQTITFMGYDMEFLRTQLAQWVKQNESVQCGVWTAKLSYKPPDNLRCEAVAVGNLSDELSREILRAGCPSYLRRRAVQVRLIWELRGLLQRILIDRQDGPASTEAMMICLLAFPSLEINLTKVEAPKQQSSPDNCEAALRIDKSDSDVSVHFNPDCIPAGKSVQRWAVTVRPRCGPQEMFVLVELMSELDNPLSVDASFCRSMADRDGEFRWEWWRDSFISRLKSVECWQRQHSMNCPEVSDSVSSISEGIRVVPVYLRGTGESLITWQGWMPFRYLICRAELLSPGFVVQAGPKRMIRIHYMSDPAVGYLQSGTAGDSKHWRTGYFNQWTTTVDLQDQVAVPYSMAHRHSLHHACMIVDEVLREATCEFDDEALKTKEREERARLVVEHANRHLSHGRHRVDLAIWLLEVASVELESTQGLSELVDLLINGQYTKKDPARAVEVIERCIAVYLGNLRSLKGRFIPEALGGRSENIHRIYRRLIRDYGHSEKVVTSYARWMSMNQGLNNDMDSEDVRARIKEALLYTRKPVLLITLASNTTVPVAAVHSSDGDSEEVSTTRIKSRVTHASSDSFRLRSTNRLRWTLLELSVNERKNVTIDACCKVPGRNHEEMGINPPRETAKPLDISYTKRRFASALFNLGNMLQHGVEGVQKDSSRAAALYEDSIENGQLEAANNLASMLLTGEGVAKNVTKAISLYDKGIDWGDLDAAYNLARLLMDGLEGVTRDQQRAVLLYEKAIEEGGHVSAMLNLATKVFHGDSSVERNPRRAVTLYERAISESEHVDAMFNLANSLLKGGEGVPMDAKRAVDLYEQVIEAEDHIESIYNLANLLVRGAPSVPSDRSRAAHLYERAIEKEGHQDSLVNLGLLLYQGSGGVPQDLARAAQLFRQAIAESGNPNAMLNLAKMLEAKSSDYERDIPMAIQLYERLIREKRNVDAMNKLANLLSVQADGIELDTIRAVSLYEQAIDEGKDSNAMFNLGLLLWDGTADVPQDRARAMQLYERAADEGNHIRAMVIFAKGICEGVESYPKDVGRAVRLYERAIAEGGSVTAMYNLARLLNTGQEGVTRDAQRAIQLYNRAVSEAQDEDSMVEIARLLSCDGNGVESNVAKAVQLYEKAIECGNNVTAMINLGVILCSGGAGVERDLRRAVELYSKATELSHNPAAFTNLALLLIHGPDGVEKDVERGVRLLNTAVEIGNVRAMYILGLILRDGVGGISPNVSRAACLFEKGAVDGKDVGCMAALAVLLWIGGDGFEKDSKRAVEFFEMAAKEGNAIACGALGHILRDGLEGVEKDAVKAVELFETGIRGGNISAMYDLACLLEKGDCGVPRDLKRCVELHRRAVREGNKVSSVEALVRILPSSEVEQEAGEVEQLRARLREIGQAASQNLPSR